MPFMGPAALSAPARYAQVFSVNAEPPAASARSLGEEFEDVYLCNDPELPEARVGSLSKQPRSDSVEFRIETLSACSAADRASQ
ncbi:uncharacterized protein SCHCODRAFT_02672677 [Schizophyllum commune H4-8]|nr:uncharacterized protein SCHCODRAFT_02672677 [Schizophyllum commune H4-8]KAI5886469.1 hypothetical protein SCHCODRAFT_02672677 [Schizophyllum commune H4-8]